MPQYKASTIRFSVINQAQAYDVSLSAVHMAESEQMILVGNADDPEFSFTTGVFSEDELTLI